MLGFRCSTFVGLSDMAQAAKELQWVYQRTPRTARQLDPMQRASDDPAWPGLAAATAKLEMADTAHQAPRKPTPSTLHTRNLLTPPPPPRARSKALNLGLRLHEVAQHPGPDMHHYKGPRTISLYTWAQKSLNRRYFKAQVFHI